MTIERMFPINNENSKVKAFFDIKTQEGIIIKGFKIIEGANGLFASVPSTKAKDDKYYDDVVFPTKEMKDKLNEMALEAYNKNHSEK
ncbi:MAG: SpoVG family protein [Melioribacteraceae bacterium]|jgi:stage V sporulation protein G|nr:hypothetical protein [Ignavibacteriota bacterium]MBZ0181391.1 SpoVG family protein [Melioribacteraceae bacterium]